MPLRMVSLTRLYLFFKRGKIISFSIVLDPLSLKRRRVEKAEEIQSRPFFYGAPQRNKAQRFFFFFLLPPFLPHALSVDPEVCDARGGRRREARVRRGEKERQITRRKGKWAKSGAHCSFSYSFAPILSFHRQITHQWSVRGMMNCLCPIQHVDVVGREKRSFFRVVSLFLLSHLVSRGFP